MFRTFVIIVEIVVLVMLLRTSTVQYFLSDVQETVSGWFSDVSMLAERQQLADLRESVQPYTADMRDYQKAYLDEVMSEKARLLSFHRMYCEQGDKNPYVYGVNLRYICEAIQRSSLMKS